jgi:hypothetical protein
LPFRLQWLSLRADCHLSRFGLDPVAHALHHTINPHPGHGGGAERHVGATIGHDRGFIVQVVKGFIPVA